jgi:predicted nucleotidyltransferase component of viral defense system
MFYFETALIQKKVYFCSFKVKNQWFNGSCKIATYQLYELVGTKLRALYQRKKGHDLFDLPYHKAASIIDAIIICL